MANSFECRNCGAALSSNEKYCKYCGSVNPNYVQQKIVSKPAPFLEAKEEINKAIVSVDAVGKRKNINWVLAIILLIFCWPIAIIYIVVKCSK